MSIILTKESEITKDDKFWESYKTHLAFHKSKVEDEKYWEWYEDRIFPKSLESKPDGLIGIYRRRRTEESLPSDLFPNLKISESMNKKRLITTDLGVVPVIFDFEKMGPKNTAVIGATGNGKTIVAYDIAEEALLQNYPVLVLDPTGQWTGFLDECTSRKMIENYPFFGIAGPRVFKGRIYIPNSNAGLPLQMNLLAKPATDDVSELRALAREVSQFIKGYCALSAGDTEDVKNVIYDTWKKGESLDYESILDAFKDEKKKKLADLIAAKVIFEGKGLHDISSLWKLGEITIIALDRMRRRENESLAMYYFLNKIIDYFDLLPDTTENNNLRLLLVIEEAHRFEDKIVRDMLDRITRTLRKKGLGTLFVTQRFVDLGEMQTNMNTKIYMRTLYTADIERASSDVGSLANKLPSLKTGVGIIFSPDIEIEKQYDPIVEFRPCLHRNTGLTEDEIRKKIH